MEQIDKRAVFSDGTSGYRSPMEPEAGEKLCLRLRLAKQTKAECTLVAQGKSYPMQIVSEDSIFALYEACMICPETNFTYWFEITEKDVSQTASSENPDKLYFYNAAGLTEQHDHGMDMCIMPGFKTPDWAKGAVMYQIFTDRFFNGDPSNDVLSDEYNYVNGHVHRITDWYTMPAREDVNNFYGGDLAGVIKKLDYLEKLGVQVIYFNPLFVSPSNHKYDTQDYDYIDPHFGVIEEDNGELLERDDSENTHAGRFISRVTSKKNLEASNDLFCKLTAEAHKRGMKVILDGVFNHCGSFNKWLDRQLVYDNATGYEPGAYKDEESPYRSFFKFTNDSWPYNTSYEGWWGYNTLPKLNYEASDKLFDYIMHIAAKWVSPPFNADGWRLDVAADLGFSPEYNHHFWKEFRKSVKKANPQAVIIAENYDDSRAWLLGDEWDSIMNYEAFMEPVTWFLTGMEKHSDSFRGDMLNNTEAFRQTMQRNMHKLNTQSLFTAMNQLSNHDHSRFLTRTNRRTGRLESLGSQAASEGINPACMREAIVIQMTWPGAPTLYYGDEAGLCGWTDPDNRRAYPWGREDRTMLAFYTELINLHKSYEALKTGAFVLAESPMGVISFSRFNENEQLVVAVNNNPWPVDIDLDVLRAGAGLNAPFARLVRTGNDGYDLNAQLYRAENGFIRLHLNENGAVILKNVPEHLL